MIGRDPRPRGYPAEPHSFDMSRLHRASVPVAADSIPSRRHSSSAEACTAARLARLSDADYPHAARRRTHSHVVHAFLRVGQPEHSPAVAAMSETGATYRMHLSTPQRSQEYLRGRPVWPSPVTGDGPELIEGGRQTRHRVSNTGGGVARYGAISAVSVGDYH
jgi:hypothetical protein